ncbi:leucine-rich repeat and immunoglobulin-like domain containing-NOGO receptor-interacting protein 4 [Macrosteles quadrilineatus]|uniref:leucine-rich repeat and immunoglobulin-like domain containing-NOGO receptor-interacting protein 4 n=1 Tax=Macrosteles quadrilineatus TaxID=74068 RepID=UPI0023E0CC6A|nr:leucine-rich repeat and immunoglobulin-like domain containing-NOGO receptor-interacting protein 4 [Macrosteles quadrilineatus]XP_054267694.1 leucine-rich repeat and immunoglobulin-like domain containing-NOGO receptor-interacting protein 4 [Macrosteles quadrilineatus]XP_054267695.1 leucine-rich repeat and immunoglobulin-like domain containing-NOGO receptor-interacting protein 4 [Macrosteles quadrilineatus]XP_054267696.1 leucine-rich repeat and immunoglobulin-like domain containing-NOGO recepto
MEYVLDGAGRCPLHATWTLKPASSSAQMFCYTVLLSVVLWATAVSAMCPPQCFCYDDTLTATCTSAKLAVFPIQLNPDVKHIDLSGNRIPSVDYTLTFYINLIHLDLSHNKIHSLGSHNFERQENLTFLNISYNHISHLGKGTFKGLKVLKLLDISNNSIESVDGGAFIDTVELEVLNLSNNKITSFEDPDVFRNLRKLKFLYLDGNQILDVPSQVLQKLPYSSIELLSLSNNYIDTLDDTSFPSPVMGSLKRLSLASNAISSIHRSSFNSLHSLSYLDLSDNNLTLVPTEQMSKLSQLVELDLSDNMFTDLPAVAFQSLFHLKILHISKMPRLSRVDSRAFVDNIHLESVLMDDNKDITQLPTRVFHGNLHLKHISIRRNSLSTIDASHFPVDNLQSLDVSENPLTCNCSLLWLWKLAVQEKKSSETLYQPSNETSESDESPVLRLSVSNLRCDSPQNLQHKLLVDVPESVVRCETTWLTVAAVTGFVLALFVVTCFVLLLISSERSLFSCKKAKDPNDVPLSGDSKHLAPNLHGGQAPVLMLMPEKEFPSDPLYLKTRPPGQVRDLRYMEPWVPVKSEQFSPVHNEYTLDITSNIRKPAHVVYV